MASRLSYRGVCVGPSLHACLWAAATFYVVGLPAPAQGFSLWVLGEGAADLINEPANFVSFEEEIITWKMDNDFRALFNTPLLQHQVRLAVDEWETAFNSPTRRNSTRYGYTRRAGPQGFFDLRSVLVHELGHAVGLQHQDASYFNLDAATGQPYLKNYRLNDDGEPYAAPPSGGEVMNEGWDEDSLPGAKPPKGLPSGAYWQTVSKDELEGLDYAYGRPVTFQEVGADEEALITLTLFAGGGADGETLGNSGPDGSRSRELGNPAAGRWINRSTISISDNAVLPIGVLPRAAAWSYRNTTGEAVEAMSIATLGTSNPDPLDSYSSGPRRFTTIEPSNTTSPNDAERRVHRFLDPVAGEIPGGNRVELGLTLDVWDWTVDSANVRTTSGAILPAALITFVDWAEGDMNYAPSTLHGPGVGLLTGQQGGFVASHRGFRIVNGETPTELVELGFASVAGLDLGLDDLTPETLDQLAAAGSLTMLAIEPKDLGRATDLIVVLSGLLDELPPELQASGDFLYLNDARWADAYAKGEILVFGKTINADHEVTAFSLLNTPVIAAQTVPEPSALALACLALAFYWRRRKSCPRSSST